MIKTTRKWKYKPFNKKILTLEKVLKIQNNKNVFLYDTRVLNSFKMGHIKNSKNVSFLKIQKKILSHKKWHKIVLIGNEERSNSAVASWALFSGYWRVFILAKGINGTPKKYLIKK